MADSGPAEVAVQEAEAVDSGPAEVAVQEAEAVDSGQAVRGKCTKQPALTVDRKPKCHSCHPVTDLYTAGNATRSTDHQRDTKYTYSFLLKWSTLFVQSLHFLNVSFQFIHTRSYHHLSMKYPCSVQSDPSSVCTRAELKPELLKQN